MSFRDFIDKQYIDWKVKPVMPIKSKYGFRIILIMGDGSEKVQQKAGFSTKTIANKERNNTIAELTNKTYIVDRKVRTKEFMNFWLEDVMRPNISNDSYKTYFNSINKYINFKLGKKYLLDINRNDLKKLYEYIYSQSKSGVRIAKTILKCSFNYAIDKKLMKVNLAEIVNFNEKEKNGKIKESYRTLNIDSKKTLNMDQVKKLIKASEGSKIHMQIIFAVLMGLRRGEINGLKYSDIDYINRTIKVQRQLGIKPNTTKEDFDLKTYTKQEIAVKTKSSNRELKIPDYVFQEILKERKKYNARKNRRKKTFQDLDYICCSSYGRPRSRSYASTHFKKILKDNNLPDIRWHDLRKTYCTILLKNNFSPKSVSILMGHAKERITVDVYGDNNEIIADCLEELEPFIEEILPKKINNDFSDDNEYLSIMEEYIETLRLSA